MNPPPLLPTQQGCEVRAKAREALAHRQEARTSCSVGYSKQQTAVAAAEAKGEANGPRAEIRMQLLTREQYFLDKIKPEYNINIKAGSNLGRSYSEEVRKKDEFS